VNTLIVVAIVVIALAGLVKLVDWGYQWRFAALQLAELVQELVAERMIFQEDRVQLIQQLKAKQEQQVQPRGVFVVPPNVIGDDDADMRA
jgi:hypothetical protein